ncbi:shikimate kinase [Terricaulis sp.]|uniref:shikimate kinase n=1 Tax=Terricaulis sp. TaxID=2768686 RepID=UPI000A64D06D|nr:shikimate kinase [Terricaulis sp.]MDZ4691776.1 shikimate kinase [Terricaulis sp.]
MTRPDSSDIGERPDAAAALRRDAAGLVPARTIALVGLMGAGKTTVGRRLAHALQLPFADADAEIVTAAGRSVEAIFAEHGECEFRRGERKVIARLLAGPVHVLATGGGAFIDPRTRALMKERAISIWLKAPLDVLMKRVSKRDDRPLLKEDDPRAVMQRLIDERYPIYAEADLTIETGVGPHNSAVNLILEALRKYQAVKA